MSSSPSLVEALLSEHTEPGDLVFDLFACFGTTLVVAESMGRRAVARELLADRVDYMRSRVGDGQPEQHRQGPPGGAEPWQCQDGEVDTSGEGVEGRLFQFQDWDALFELRNTAAEALRRGYREGRHHVAAAVRVMSGDIVTGLHLETSIGRVALCAEAVAVGRTVSTDGGEIAAVVAVNFPGRNEGVLEPHVLPPCGMCRELLLDYADGAVVAITDSEWVSVKDLLPSARLPYQS